MARELRSTGEFLSIKPHFGVQEPYAEGYLAHIEGAEYQSAFRPPQVFFSGWIASESICGYQRRRRTVRIVVAPARHRTLITARVPRAAPVRASPPPEVFPPLLLFAALAVPLSLPG